MALAPGTLINGRYRIERILGKGGMGAVYLANDESLGILCAVKENLNLSPESERLFRREATLLASLRHPHLPRVTNHFVLGGEQYLVMDYVEGEDLKERLARLGPLPPDDVLRWATQICDALGYLHERNPPIIHRDVKPGNIKLTASGEAMLVDFGIAKVAVPGQHTTTGSFALTPGFAPPEQYGHGGHTDPRTDQYALAATLYILLTGERPPDSMERLLGNAPLVPPDELRPDVSRQVTESLIRALEIKPDDRFPSIAAFKAALLGQASARETTRSAEAYPTMLADSPAARQPTRVAAGPPAPTQIAAGQAVEQPRPRQGLGLALAGLGAVLLLALAFVGGGALIPRLVAGAASPTLTASLTPPASATPAPTVIPAIFSTETAPPPSATASATAEPSATLAPPSETFTPEASPTPEGTALAGGSGRIAFVSNRNGEFYQIYTMRADGSSVEQLTFDPTNKWDPAWLFNGTQLAWSPDGTRLLYVAPGGPGNGLDLWMVNADGSSQVDLTLAPGDDFQPAWCADGTIAFTSTRTNDVRQIFTMTLDDARPRNYSAGHNSPIEYDLAWFPDCQRKILVTTQNGVPELWRDFPDLASYRIFRSDIPFNASAEDPAVSPDGAYVLYTRRTREANEIMLASVDDRLSNAQLTSSLGNSAPQWSPDGRWILFVSTRDQNREVYVMTAAGTGQVNLTNHPATDTDPVWQP